MPEKKTRKVEKENDDGDGDDDDDDDDDADAKASQSLVDTSVIILDESADRPQKPVVEVDLTAEESLGKAFDDSKDVDESKVDESRNNDSKVDELKVDESPHQKSPSLLKPKKAVASESSDAKSAEESDSQLKLRSGSNMILTFELLRPYVCDGPQNKPGKAAIKRQLSHVLGQ